MHALYQVPSTRHWILLYLITTSDLISTHGADTAVFLTMITTAGWNALTPEVFVFVYYKSVDMHMSIKDRNMGQLKLTSYLSVT
ncbi:uncharacterized protein EDB93DRAFT_1148202 [Suillus bovinus]|uniref:uncharacterized protein n=1 Tax=Suillus bovinus TaxID=48563 RepID=UPI001B87277B|nr:uncharacterized protein EDB93DRAFT_1148202 [Suillus bovinus]KAG2146945.1 hypothetical protein EDB93DRAFT_1148202 [Suillus bovinus]